MEISIRTKQLKALFSYDKSVDIADRSLEIRPFRFTQDMGVNEIERVQQLIPASKFCAVTDNGIAENKSFSYTVFKPKGKEKLGDAILLLHGLNERNWDKYLTWAEYLSLVTGKAVILFPIAFHMNRTPDTWYNPRVLMSWVVRRKQEVEHLNNCTFVNVALSYRLSDSPLRFYISGKESMFNLWQLFREIKTGQHPLFREDTSINIFAYSIGALLAQILALANPDGLLDESRLFLFCGGSIFSQMDGSARDIMDYDAYRRVKNYFLNDFLSPDGKCRELCTLFQEDFMAKAFKAMIRPEVMKEYRESFFEQARERLRIVTLKKDVVMPTRGVIDAIGAKCAEVMLEELDFPFEYSHQHPFPTNTGADAESLSGAFKEIFNRAANFL